jgi:DNA processing protein
LAKRPPNPTLFTPAPLPVAALDDSGRLACLRLIRSSNVGPVAFRELINHFGGAEAALEALPEIAARGRRRSIRICPTERAEAELEAAHRIGASPLFTIEPGYPAALAASEQPPPLLYIKGRHDLLNQASVAIVGSRKASAAGSKLARQFAHDLQDRGFVVVSGLARGIDAQAHQAALPSTVAVVAGGLDVIYPPEHDALQAQIAEQGCVVSEMPPGFRPRGVDFPRRNRIIAGLSLGVVVVEAARKSGTLVTARLAAEMGRDVFAVPGHPLDPRAFGTNQLIKSGATLVTHASDVIEALQTLAGDLRPLDGVAEHAATFARPPPEPVPPPNDTDTETVLSALGPHPIEIDELARATGLSIRDVRIILLECDLDGVIERHGAQMVSLRPTSEPPPATA